MINSPFGPDKKSPSPDRILWLALLAFGLGALILMVVGPTIARAQTAQPPRVACIDYKSLDGTLTYEATTTGDAKLCPNASVSKVADTFIGFACAENLGVMPCATIAPRDKPAHDPSIRTCSASKMTPSMDDIFNMQFEPWATVWQTRGSCGAGEVAPTDVPARTLKLGLNGLQLCINPGSACLAVGVTTFSPNALARLAELGWKGPIADMLKRLLDSVTPKKGLPI